MDDGCCMKPGGVPCWEYPETPEVPEEELMFFWWGGMYFSVLAQALVGLMDGEVSGLELLVVAGWLEQPV